MSTETSSPYCNPEVWGGLECTINRVGDVFRDQLADAGHYTRPNDIQQFAALGIAKLRYPVLWEHHQPDKDGNINWQWISKQLNILRDKNIVPIAGLLHHGSGPLETNMLDNAFPVKLAAYASSVAKQFPWIEYYTPVNEPLTTARFSGLYGFWYPHHNNELSFIRMLLHQVKGTVLSMQAIRKVNPSAKLVQTEDLSKTHSTPLLSYQAAFENNRRWLTYDLLCGVVNQQHYFWNYFLSLGITERELGFFIENKCPPDILGFNYYVTSERYLDENLQMYPASAHGGNGKHRYADAEAVRTGHMEGLGNLLQEAWTRYRLPMAVTECHLNCTREEQLRWLKEIWDTCCSAVKQGIPVKAVTAWSLLGSYDWSSLLLMHNRHYETGVFDVRDGNARPTLLAHMLSSLSVNGDYQHPLLEQKGWWHRQQLFGSVNNHSTPLLIIGKNERLSDAFIKICIRRAIPFIAVPQTDAAIGNEENIRLIITENKPWGVINTVCETTKDGEINNISYSTHAIANVVLAKTCYEKGVQFMNVYSDRVFYGKAMSYYETEQVTGLTAYETLVEEQRIVSSANPSALMVSIGSFICSWNAFNFADTVLKLLEQDQQAVDLDNTVLLNCVTHLADAALDIFIDGEKGLWHITNEGLPARTDFVTHLALQRADHRKMFMSKAIDEMGWEPSATV